MHQPRALQTYNTFTDIEQVQEGVSLVAGSVVVLTIIQLGHVSNTGIFEVKFAQDPPKSMSDNQAVVLKKLTKARHRLNKAKERQSTA